MKVVLLCLALSFAARVDTHRLYLPAVLVDQPQRMVVPLACVDLDCMQQAYP